MKEADLAAHVVRYLEGFDVWQEVAFGSGVADIVVDVNGLGWIIECKTSFSLAVLEQADQWIRQGAARVSIAVPRQRNYSRGRSFGVKCALLVGIGILEVDCAGWINEKCAPKFFRPRKDDWYAGDILSVVNDQMRGQCPAGSARGGHWTAFKGTCRNVLEVVKEHPGIKIKDLLSKVSHHYSSNASARSCIPKWVDAGKIPGVVSRDGCFYPTD